MRFCTIYYTNQVALRLPSQNQTGLFCLHVFVKTSSRQKSAVARKRFLLAVTCSVLESDSICLFENTNWNFPMSRVQLSLCDISLLLLLLLGRVILARCSHLILSGKAGKINK